MNSKLSENSNQFQINATIENDDNIAGGNRSELDEIQVMMSEDSPYLVDTCIDLLNDSLMSECVILEALLDKGANLHQRMKQLLTEIEADLNKCGL